MLAGMMACGVTTVWLIILFEEVLLELVFAEALPVELVELGPPVVSEEVCVLVVVFVPFGLLLVVVVDEDEFELLVEFDDEELLDEELLFEFELELVCKALLIPPAKNP